MAIKATKFTPEVLLSAPRRSAGAPNSSGQLVLFSVTEYSFAEHRKTSQIRVLNLAEAGSTLLYEGTVYSEPVWIDDDVFFFLKSGDKGTTSLLVGRASQPGAEPAEIHTFDGGVSNLQVLHLADGAIAIALSGLADPSGHLYNAEREAETKKALHSSARVYTKLFVRHWDAYVTENKQAIWYGRVERKDAAAAANPAAAAQAVASDGKTFALVSDGLTNLLAGTKLQSPVPPFGGAGDFALSPHGIAFVSRDPSYSEALNTVTNLYFAPLKTFAEPAPLSPPHAIKTGPLGGYSASPAFSPDGRSLAFTRMRSTQYESDKPQLLLVPDITRLASDAVSDSEVVAFYATEDGDGAWDARPESIVWTGDGAELFVTAEYHGRNSLYRLPSNPSETARFGLPHRIVGAGCENVVNEDLSVSEERGSSAFQHLKGHGSISDVRFLTGRKSDNRLFLSSSSLTESTFFSIVDAGPAPASLAAAEAAGQKELRVVSSPSRHGAAFGLSREQVGEIWFKGAGDYRVHALVVRPSDFHDEKNKGRKWPLALLIHGGPQGAWADSWSTRWNPAIFAEQGYIVVAPNPTGSTGYGMALQNGIRNQWGGLPYLDIVQCVDYVEATLPFVDLSRAVALGASYGGYMMNWIQGQPLGRRLKAIVCHDGVFSTLNQYCSEELFFPLHDFGGSLWENRKGYEEWDPAKNTGEWATPMLVIHNELDYRLPVTEGLAMFNVLQSRNVPSRLLSFSDENHWVLKPENSLVWHQEVLDWINKYAEVNAEEDKDKDLAEGTAKVQI